MADQNQAQDDNGGGGTKQRGPNFPSISLEKAVEFAQALYDKEKRAAVPVAVILGHWGYKNPKSSTATMAIAALRAYGLVDYQPGGNTRSAKLSTRALKIILDTPERDAELREAALGPKLHRQIWEKYKEDGLPSDQTLKHYLIFDLDFNDAAVDGFLARLRTTFSLAKLTDGGTLSEKDRGRPPVVGDRIQWTNSGQAQFAEPALVTGLSDDGQFVFVDGSNAGLPIGEVTVVAAASTQVQESGKDAGKAGAGVGADVFSQAQAIFKGGGGTPPLAPARPGVKSEAFSLDDGEVLVRWPARLSPAEFDDVAAWLDILKRKIKRGVQGADDAAAQ